MKLVIFDEVYNTKSLSPQGIEFMGQDRLDQWLGKDKVKFEVKQLDAKFYSLRYGERMGAGMKIQSGFQIAMSISWTLMQ